MKIRYTLEFAGIAKTIKNLFDFVLRRDASDLTSDSIIDSIVGFQIRQNRLFRRRQSLMANMDDYAAVAVFDNRILQAKCSHGLERRIQAFANVLVGWIRKLVDEADDHAIARELLDEDILRSDVTRQSPRTLDFYPIVKDANLNIGCDAVISVQNRIGYDFMQRLVRILDAFEAGRAENLNTLNYPHGLANRRRVSDELIGPRID